MSEYFFRGVTERFLAGERAALATGNPATVPVIISWRGRPYVGLIQPYPHNPEISYVIKSPEMPEGFMDALRELDPERPEMRADDSLELDGREYFLRQRGHELNHLTACDAAHLTEAVPLAANLPRMCSNVKPYR